MPQSDDAYFQKGPLTSEEQSSAVVDTSLSGCNREDSI